MKRRLVLHIFRTFVSVWLAFLCPQVQEDVDVLREVPGRPVRVRPATLFHKEKPIFLDELGVAFLREAFPVVERFFSTDGMLDATLAAHHARPLLRVFELLDLSAAELNTEFATLRDHAVTALGVHAVQWRNERGIGYDHVRAVIAWRGSVRGDADAVAVLEKLK